MFSLYVHVPYCTSICPYCDFNVYAAARRPEAAYVQALLAEMGAAAKAPPWRGDTLGTIYVGGGTPSLFEPASIARLLAGARAHWEIDEDAEITLEATPESVDAARLDGFRRAGINRVSLGLQSMHAAHLARLGRAHGVDDNVRAVEAVRAAGLSNLSVDLIFGVPGQRASEWEADLGAVIALAPQHVSAYGLTYEERTPFYAWRERGTLQPVDEEDEAAMFRLARRILPAAGYHAYEVSSFALEGFRSRHNGNYWSGASYLGLGAGAHSYDATASWGRRWSNERDPGRYMKGAGAGGPAAGQVEDLTREQAMGEFTLLGLRRTEGVDVDAFAARFDEAFEARFPRLGSLVADGLVEAGDGRFRLSARGLLLADSVVEALFPDSVRLGS